jgi:hypothetical protein
MSGISLYSGVPYVPIKKGVRLQKFGATSGYTKGVIKEVNVPVKVNACQHFPYDYDENGSCDPVDIYFSNTITVNGSDSGVFSQSGDSGSLALTRGACPQPVGMVIAGKGGESSLSPIPLVLQNLQSNGGFSSLSLVPSPGGCGTTAIQISTGSSDSDYALEDGTVGDPDTIQAYVSLSDFVNSFGVQYEMMIGNVDGVAIDLSGSTAQFDVKFESSSEFDAADWYIPTSFEGTPVEQSVIDTFDTTQDGIRYSD